MKPEAKFWQWLKAATYGLWHVQRHEDRYSVGIPDLSYGADGVGGWVELKAYTKWPTRGLPHFTVKQANWMVERGTTGGNCFLLVRVGSTILIFNHLIVHVLQKGPCGEKMLRAHAIRVWDSGFDRAEFLNIITGKIEWVTIKCTTGKGIE